MALKNTGEVIQDWEVDEMMKDGDENADKIIDFDGKVVVSTFCKVFVFAINFVYSFIKVTFIFKLLQLN